MSAENKPVQYARIHGFHEESEGLQAKRQAAIKALGRKWLGHPENRIKRKPS